MMLRRIQLASRPQHKRKKRQRFLRSGLTLIEVLVASALLTTLLAALWSMVDLFTSLGIKGEAEARALSTAENIYQQVAQDLRGVPRAQQKLGGVPILFGTTERLEFWTIADASLERVRNFQQDDEPPSRLGPFRSGPMPTSDPHLETSAAGTSGTWPNDPAGPQNLELHRVRYWFRGYDAMNFFELHAPFMRQVDISLGPVAVTTTPVPTQDERTVAPLPLFATGHLAEERNLMDDRQGMAARNEWRVRHPVKTEQEVFPEIEAVRFAYFDGKSWYHRWDSRVSHDLPVAVRLDIWFEGGTSLSPQRSETEQAGRDAAHQDELEFRQGAASEEFGLSMDSDFSSESILSTRSSLNFGGISDLAGRQADLHRLFVLRPGEAR